MTNPENSARAESPSAVRMRRIREYHGLNQRRFAERLGVSIGRWNNYERGYTVTPWIVQRLIQITPGLTWDFIMTGKTETLRLDLARFFEGLDQDRV